ncbi:amidase family protein [Mycoplasma struthionis]|uniref:Asp-tRNA(Asn)/Glu-tRNA(Gln) amidotransferase subunit GatA n=1 Tax=Mycoplasma struthionis TaxID=538220 RepID=A0A3G8LG78_9MOLU|nr:amidase family protein [Mycoplasma struthionis]AZG68673.1 Asp-tRNA(Asn)/Glu-tRNA(Gln) amidotransferase subunit GatA [Mycoplasma struthionis]
MKNKGNLSNAILELKNDKNNAICHVFENVKLKNEGLLANTVFTVKDNYADLNVEATGSSLLLKNFKPNYEATILKLLRNAGASCVARTNLDEFGLGGSGEYSSAGIIKNPLNNDYLVGGSSSGAAASFSSNISFAIGSDTGDSVRKPASNIGVVGFKPSYGAISRYGLYAFASSLDTVAYFSHNVLDSAYVTSVLFKQDLKHDLTSLDLSFDIQEIKETKPQKVAYLDCFNYVSEAIKNSYQELLNKLKNEGVELVKIEVNESLLNAIDVVYKVISFSEASSNLANLTGVEFGNRLEGENWEQTYLKTRSELLGKMVQSRLILGSLFLSQENQIKYFVKAKKMRRYLSNYFTEIHKKADIFIYPAANDVAPKFNERYEGNFMDFILTNANLTGNPSLTLKLGNDKQKDNMPFNLAIDAELYQDKKLLNHALYIEKIIGDKNE